MPQATLLDDVCTSVGYTATCVLSAWFGGRKLYVPGTARADHPLCGLLGRSALAALVRDWGGQELKIPSQRTATRMLRDRRACELFAEGWTAARVADDLGIGVRRAEQLRRELESNGWLAFATGRASRNSERAGSCAIQAP